MYVYSTDNIKYTKQAFCSRSSVRKAAEKFADGLIDRFVPQSKLKVRQMENYARRFIPEIEIVNFTNSKEALEMDGLCKPAYVYSSGKYSFDGVVLFLKTKFKDDFSKRRLLKNFVHEMTHAFQFKDKEISDMIIFNNFLKHHSKTELERMINLSNRVFDSEQYTKDIEDIVNPLIDRAYGIDAIKPEFSFVEYFRNLFAEDVQRLRAKGVKFDLNFIKKVFINQTEAEADAYKAGGYFMKKSSPYHCTDYYSEIWAKVHHDLAVALKTSNVE